MKLAQGFSGKINIYENELSKKKKKGEINQNKERGGAFEPSSGSADLLLSVYPS